MKITANETELVSADGRVFARILATSDCTQAVLLDHDGNPFATVTSDNESNALSLFNQGEIVAITSIDRNGAIRYISEGE